jgi:hypothetical protein
MKSGTKLNDDVMANLDALCDGFPHQNSKIIEFIVVKQSNVSGKVPLAMIE